MRGSRDSQKGGPICRPIFKEVSNTEESFLPLFCIIFQDKTRLPADLEKLPAEIANLPAYLKKLAATSVEYLPFPFFTCFLSESTCHLLVCFVDQKRSIV